MSHVGEITGTAFEGQKEYRKFNRRWGFDFNGKWDFPGRQEL